MREVIVLKKRTLFEVFLILALLTSISYAAVNQTVTLPVEFTLEFHNPSGELIKIWQDANKTTPLTEIEFGTISVIEGVQQDFTYDVYIENLLSENQVQLSLSGTALSGIRLRLSPNQIDPTTTIKACLTLTYTERCTLTAGTYSKTLNITATVI